MEMSRNGVKVWFGFLFLFFWFWGFFFLQIKQRSEGGLIVFSMVLHDSFPINFQRQNQKINVWHYGMDFDDDMTLNRIFEEKAPAENVCQMPA